MPQPKEGENRKGFLDRCMSDDKMTEEFPDQDQRFAVCVNYWESYINEAGRMDKSQIFQSKTNLIRSRNTVKSGDRVVVGYATTEDIALDNYIFTGEALRDAQNDLLEKSTVLFNHDDDRPIGKVVETAVDDYGLLVKCVISKEEDEIWNKVQEGIINKFSIQGRALETTPIQGEGEEEVLRVTKLELFETSLVSVPGVAEAKTLTSYIVK